MQGNNNHTPNSVWEENVPDFKRSLIGNMSEQWHSTYFIWISVELECQLWSVMLCENLNYSWLEEAKINKLKLENPMENH